MKRSTTSTETSRTTGCSICGRFTRASTPESTTPRLSISERKCAACGTNCGKPALLDLFCGAGGAARGYQQAGFCVLGVDVKPQPHYAGCRFHQADALRFLRALTDPTESGIENRYINDFDAIHASPPCQAYSTATTEANRSKHPDLYGPTVARLTASGVPYIIENVIGAPYGHGVILCGATFGLEADGEWIERHRNFETSWLIFQPDHSHEGFGRPFTITGAGTKEKPKGGRAYETAHSKKPDVAEFPKYMGMTWANPFEAAQAIPPAYTYWIGCQLMVALGHEPNALPSGLL